MSRGLRFIAVCLAMLAIGWAVPRAQGTQGQKPPDSAAKPADQQAKPQPPAQVAPGEIAPEDYPPDFKAFNAAAAEKDVARRTEALQRFIADNPTSVLVGQARSIVQSALLTTLRDSQKKYLDLANAEIEALKTPSDSTPAAPEFMAYGLYNRLAAEMLRNGVLLDEAEKYARTGVSLMDEQKYLDYRRQTAGRAPAARRERAAGGSGAGYSISTRDGVMVARPMGARPSSASAAIDLALTRAQETAPPRPPTDQEILASFRSEQAGARATLGQILVKRGKTDEGEKVLKEAYAARPSSSTMATIAKILAESAKKAGDTAAQMEYLTTLALSGRMTADDRQELEAAYKKAHGGSLDGLEDMLDARYRRDNARFEVTPFARKPAAAGTQARAVLAEMFTGAG